MILDYEGYTKTMTLKTLPVIQPSSSSPLFSLTPFSWLFLNRRRRILFLTLCSPVLLPLLCLTLPLICLVHLYICLCRRARRRDDGGGAGRLRRCEEGREFGEEEEEQREIGWMLLQRYLEDQLGLVGSVVAAYDCGGDEEVIIDDLADHQVSEIRRPLLL